MTFSNIPGREDDNFGPPPPPFRIRRRRVDFRSFGGYNRWIVLGVVVVLAYLTLNTAKSIYIDWLWFEGAGFEAVYTKMIVTKVALFAGGMLLFALFFGGNVWWAARLFVRSAVRGLMDSEAADLQRLGLLAVIAGTLFFGVIFGTAAASQWDVALRFLNGTSFGVDDPQFGRDVGFYVFTLPALNAIYGWLMAMVVLTTLACAGLYLGRFLMVGAIGFDSGPVKRHLVPLLVLVVALYIFNYWLLRFELNFAQNGAVFGAGYTDIHARLPFLYVGMGLGALTMLALIVSMFRRGVGLGVVSMIVWAVVLVAGSRIYPATVQRLNVQPNELERERPYIERNIDMTRRAFGLDRLEERPFPASPEVTPQEIAANPETMRNIRLLDVEPLRQTYGQIQTIRPLYEFLDVDVDRYMIDGVRRQVMIAARELSPGRLPTDAQSWVNRRLQFTHGYGAVVSPVNEVVQEGLPELFLRDMPVTGKLEITQPQIYYGEEPEHYVIVKTRAQEFDYQDETGIVQNTFEGEGGIKMNSIFRRALLAWEFADLNILISDQLTNESRLLFRRNIQDRVTTVAPFLTLDRDPYVVIADGKLYWIQDAYTTTSRYPYSQPSADGRNYIRNSAKVVIDAYDGSMTFYLADDTDPIARAYSGIFPELFTPMSEMPESLRSHVRYPEDMFLEQVNKYRLYHITDPVGIYNQEDIWNIPTELSGSGTDAQVKPYYVIMRMPGESTEEFALILPLTPARRQNTIAWVAARADGDNYGKLLSFRFPTDSLVFGPRQVESRIDQDTVISQQFSLWDQSGSNVIRGNLLMIPIGRGNLFVEPIYLQAATSQLPELKRVVVVNGNRIAMEPTLERSLEVIFGRAAPTLPTEDPDGGTGTAPSPQATPTATPSGATPAATATPQPATTPPAAGSVSELARQAEEAFQRAQDALRNNDFATYGQEINRAQQLIRQIVQMSP